MDIKAILLQVPLIRFLLTKLFSEVSGNRYFRDISNYISKLLVIFKIYRDIVVELLNSSTSTIHFGLIITLYNYNITKQMAAMIKNVNRIRN